MEGGLEGKRIIIQGLGNVGYHAAKFLQEEDGAKVIAIIEYNGSLVNEDGLPVEKVKQYIIEHGGVKGFPDATFIEDGGSLLEMDCDILIPAAMEGVVNLDNANRIQAKLIAEAANGPVTFEADSILRERGITIIPDAYLNAGGVIVSYFEWIQNLSHIRFGRMQRRHDELRGRHLSKALETLSDNPLPEWIKSELERGADEIDLVRSGLHDGMRLAYRKIREEKENNDKVDDLRTAAFVIAINKISHAYLDVGIY